MRKRLAKALVLLAVVSGVATAAAAPAVASPASSSSHVSPADWSWR